MYGRERPHFAYTVLLYTYMYNKTVHENHHDNLPVACFCKQLLIYRDLCFTGFGPVHIESAIDQVY